MLGIGTQLSWAIRNSQVRVTKQVNELGFKPFSMLSLLN